MVASTFGNYGESWPTSLKTHGLIIPLISEKSSRSTDAIFKKRENRQF